MLKVENVEVWGFEHAIRGMRNPMNSWDKSDSGKGCINKLCTDCGFDHNWCGNTSRFVIGKNDLELMKKLYDAGAEHRQYLRQIFVSMDITAPLYWWKEFDTYKIGTTSNSCSTMHKIHAKEFELDDFSTDHLIDFSWNRLDDLIGHLNICRSKYLETSDKEWWWQIIQLLPSSYNQRRTITFNYENAVNIIHQRAGHKLDEWFDLVTILRDLPYIGEIMAEDREEEE